MDYINDNDNEYSVNIDFASGKSHNFWYAYLGNSSNSIYSEYIVANYNMCSITNDSNNNFALTGNSIPITDSINNMYNWTTTVEKNNNLIKKIVEKVSRFALMDLED